MFAERIYELYARWEEAQETGSLFVVEDHASPEEVGDLNRLIQELRPKPPPDGPAAPAVAKVFAGFRLMGILGEGGFGTVYRAEDVRLRRKVALKVLHQRALSRPQARENFLAEARALASVQHDNVIPIFQVGEDDGRPFLAMPLLGGETLAARIERDGALPASEVKRIGRETAAGLAAIHAKGLVHRDLKPGNIWLEAGTGRVKVLDLGLAQDPLSSGSSSGYTVLYVARTGRWKGTGFSLGLIQPRCGALRVRERPAALQTRLGRRDAASHP